MNSPPTDQRTLTLAEAVHLFVGDLATLDLLERSAAVHILALARGNTPFFRACARTDWHDVFGDILRFKIRLSIIECESQVLSLTAVGSAEEELHGRLHRILEDARLSMVQLGANDEAKVLAGGLGSASARIGSMPTLP